MQVKLSDRSGHRPINRSSQVGWQVGWASTSAGLAGRQGWQVGRAGGSAGRQVGRAGRSAGMAGLKGVLSAGQQAWQDFHVGNSFQCGVQLFPMLCRPNVILSMCIYIYTYCTRFALSAGLGLGCEVLQWKTLRELPTMFSDGAVIDWCPTIFCSAGA